MSLAVSELIVFPVKSLRGVNLRRSDVEGRGLKHDRRWMLVDEKGEFLTQRKLKALALFNTAIEEHGLCISVGADTPIRVPFEPEGPPREVRVWDTPVDACEVGREANEWFSDALGMTCALVYMPDSSLRALRAPNAREGEKIAFSDSNPVLVASEASIRDLNARLSVPIPIRRFRPNIVVEGCGPFEEDQWQELHIGPIRFRFSMRCGRCLVTTIDIETGIASDEPLRTLNTYRKEGSHVWFGSYYVPEANGSIAVGDAVSAR